MTMNTETLIKRLRSIMPLGPLAEEIHKAAADRLEELQLELTETKEELDCAQAEIKRAHIKADKAYALRKNAEVERDSLRDTMALDMLELTQQRDEARAEAELLKQGNAMVQRIPNAQQIRPEPSRLEIAAMFYAAGYGPIEDALKRADALIAATREGK